MLVTRSVGVVRQRLQLRSVRAFVCVGLALFGVAVAAALPRHRLASRQGRHGGQLLLSCRECVRRGDGFTLSGRSQHGTCACLGRR